MDVNEPDVVEEVTAEFAGYEAALMANDIDALIAFFWDDPVTVRFGVVEELYGWSAIAAYRRGRPPAPRRELMRTNITTFGRDTAIAVTEYLEQGASQVGRQSQTWVRLPEGWRIVHAHVSLPPRPGTTDQI